MGFLDILDTIQIIAKKLQIPGVFARRPVAPQEKARPVDDVTEMLRRQVSWF